MHFSCAAVIEDSQMKGECMSNKETKSTKKQMVLNYVIDTEITRLPYSFVKLSTA